MRNIFDQYSQPENKLTHSLVSSLSQDTNLLIEFLRWSVGKKCTKRNKLNVIEQSLPGHGVIEEKEAERKGLPDACIFDDNGWMLVIESKVASQLSINQLKRHYSTIVKRGYQNPSLLVITAEFETKSLPKYVHKKTWREIYEWGIRQSNRSVWPNLFTKYFEVLEARMVQDEYLKAGALTKFSGIPFDADNPYSYIEAKRLLRLLIAEFKQNRKLIKELGVDPRLPGRGAIKGTKGTVVWDFLRFRESKATMDFTRHPHLTFGIMFDRVEMMLTLPHRLNTEYRNRIFNLNFDEFHNLITLVSNRMSKSIDMDEALKPTIKLLQRHYLSQSHSGIVDAVLNYDLRTIAKSKGKEKYQPEWISATYSAMKNKKSNLQMQIGVEIRLGRSKVVKTEQAIRVLQESARALVPFLDVVFERN